MSRQDLQCRLRDDRGSGTIWALGVVLVALLLSAPIVDGGTAIAAKVAADDIAQQAARAGANQLDLRALRQRGTLQLDPAAAIGAARAYLREQHATGSVTATTGQISVTVTATTPTVLLGLVGIDHMSVRATEHATPVTGA